MTDWNLDTETLTRAITECPALLDDMRKSIGEAKTEDEKLLMGYCIEFGENLVKMAQEIVRLRGINETLERCMAKGMVIQRAEVTR